ncbi:MAG: hypothetical protein Q4B58_07560, partial [Bacteroidales bacterium]|nr:hypothetical protein [Bacteroidales bacterium]
MIFCALVNEVQAQNADEPKVETIDAKKLARRQKIQRDSLKLCLKEARYYTNDKQAYNFDKARGFLKLAFDNPLGKENPEVLIQAGHTEYQCFHTERNKPAKGKKIDEKVIYSSTAAGFEYYTKGYDELKKKEHASNAKQMQLIRSNAYELFRSTQGFRATAGFYYTQQNWTKAHHFFRMGLDAIEGDLLNDYAQKNDAMARDFERFKNDSVRDKLMYSCAVTAVKMGDHALAISELEAAKPLGIETFLVYQQLCLEYEAIGDLEGFERILREGQMRMPDSLWFSKNLLNLYLSQHALEKALAVSEQVTELDPDNAGNYELKGKLQEELGLVEEAEKSYIEALKRDSLLLESNENLGRLYFNMAVKAEENYIENRRFDDIYGEVVPMYEKALPYYYKAYEADVKREEKQIATAIRT